MGIYKITLNEECKINKNIFKIIDQKYKELQFQNIKINKNNTTITIVINLLRIQEYNKTLDEPQKIKEITFSESNHHSYII